MDGFTQETRALDLTIAEFIAEQVSIINQANDVIRGANAKISAAAAVDARQKKIPKEAVVELSPDFKSLIITTMATPPNEGTKKTQVTFVEEPVEVEAKE